MLVKDNNMKMLCGILLLNDNNGNGKKGHNIIHMPTI